MNPKVPFPKPPYLYKNYKDNLMERINPILTSKQTTEDKSLEKFLPPKLPSSENYFMFGERLSTKEIEFEKHKQDTIKELKKINHFIIFKFLDLLSELGKEGGQTNSIINQIEENFLKFHKLINFYRPIQARKNLFSILNYQLNNIINNKWNFNECIGNIKLMVIQMKALIETFELNTTQINQNEILNLSNSLKLIKTRTKITTSISTKKLQNTKESTPSKQCTHLDEVYDSNLLQIIDNII